MAKKNICQFCGKSASEVDKIITATTGASICNECIDICYDILESMEDEEKGKHEHQALKVIKPHKIKEFLDEYIISQEDAKKQVAVAVFNHLKRIKHNSKLKEDENDKAINKANIVMLGESGVGKSYIWKVIADMLDVPFVVADAPSFTSAGYVGADVDELLVSAFREADYDLERAEHAIIVLDEGDKLARKSGEYAAADKDVSGEAVQQSLLKMIEGTDVEIYPSGKHGLQAEPVIINTSNILFIINGSFEGIDRIIKDRLSKHIIGFGEKQEEYTKDDLLKRILPQDLIKFGMIPELVGRSPVIIPLETLTEEDLIEVLSKPKGALLKQYQELFNIDNVELNMEDNVLKYIAKLSKERKLNARGLRAIMEAILQSVMYQYPQEKKLQKVYIIENIDKIAAA